MLVMRQIHSVAVGLFYPFQYQAARRLARMNGPNITACRVGRVINLYSTYIHCEPKKQIFLRNFAKC